MDSIELTCDQVVVGVVARGQRGHGIEFLDFSGLRKRVVRPRHRQQEV